MSEPKNEQDDDLDSPPTYESLFTGSIPELSSSTGQRVASLEDDGRFTINLGSHAASLVRKLTKSKNSATVASYPLSKSSDEDSAPATDIPPLNIVILVVGSRGDVQPFLALGQELIKYGHTVRLGTHAIFEPLVRKHGLQFFSIGGDPAQLMAYMVRNPRLVPGFYSLCSGDVHKNRRMISEILVGCWHACIDPGTDEKRPFVADAIIANPPSYAHIHCAERLSIPLHIMFTMPWTLTWQGLYDVVNYFRTDVLGLESLSLSIGATLLDRLNIPHTYCWSPSLVPKPPDWGNHLDISGFFFTDGATAYTPSDSLVQFLNTEKPVIFIGLGSIVVDDPDRLTAIIEDAVNETGTRVVLSEGWSKLGRGCKNERILVIGDVPHDWLFPRVAATIHHGGAGTTATGLRFGKPTVVIPFFGDQPFWGSVVANAGAGPPPIPQNKLTAHSLANAICFCLQNDVRKAAVELQNKMASENGPLRAVESFHRSLPLDTMRCSITETELAVWRLKDNPKYALSSAAAVILLQNKHIKRSQIVLCKHRQYDTENQRWDPMTAIASSFLSSVATLAKDATSLVASPVNEIQTYRRESALDPTSGQKAGSKAAVGKAIGVGISKGVGKVAMFPLRTGMKLNEAAANGLNNLPKLYGDDTVRKAGRVHDLKSGEKAGSEAFYHGLYDGVTGLVTQPLAGAQGDGFAGFAVGMGRGLAGVIVKPTAGIAGLTGYAFKGLRMSLDDLWHENPDEAIAALRLEQGFQDDNLKRKDYQHRVVSAFVNIQQSGFA